jgi:hypothetical protein
MNQLNATAAFLVYSSEVQLSGTHFCNGKNEDYPTLRKEALVKKAELWMMQSATIFT